MRTSSTSLRSPRPSPQRWTHSSRVRRARRAMERRLTLTLILTLTLTLTTHPNPHPNPHSNPHPTPTPTPTPNQAREGVTPRALVACLPAWSEGGPWLAAAQAITHRFGSPPACSGLPPRLEKSARDALVPCPKSSKSTALNPPRCAAHGDVGPLRKRARGARAHARRLHRRGARGHGSGRVPVLVRGRRGGACTSAGG